MSPNPLAKGHTFESCRVRQISQLMIMRIASERELRHTVDWVTNVSAGSNPGVLHHARQKLAPVFGQQPVALRRQVGRIYQALRCGLYSLQGMNLMADRMQPAPVSKNLHGYLHHAYSPDTHTHAW